MITYSDDCLTAVIILNSIDTSHLLELVNNYYRLNQKTTPLKKLYEELEKAIPAHLIAFTEIDKPEFYRVRKSIEPFKEYKEFWAPPKNIATLGRLNKANESMFYISLDPVTPIHEAKILKGECFTLMFYSYKTNKKINALMIDGIPYYLDEELKKIGLSKIGYNNYRIIYNLIRNEFVKDVGIGNEYLYNFTNLIKDIFDAEKSIEGFIYSSIRNYQHKNCALKPSISQELLECTGCIYGRLIDFSNSGETAIIEPFKKSISKIRENQNMEYELLINGKIKLKMN
ncbi:hypothetical protein LAD12857_00530 [Lacrimispora amygdalina]|uniref:RES domain-containing protein n=1 Tax=Lacrimispora amygdalina TaxID=253257 RepID=A0ABQ5M0S7_9FIRM